MRFSVLVFALVGFLTSLGAARADHAPAFVVPGRVDVPVIINGYNASWGVVEGDWGLYRPGAVSPVVITAPNLLPPPPAARWFPSLGGAPRAGRYEIEPPAHRALPPPAQSFYRNWSTAPDNAPVTEYAPSPPIIYAPPGRRW